MVARRGAGGAHRRDPAPAAVALARPRPRRDPRLQPQAGGRARGRDGARAGRHGARAGRAAARRRGPTVVVLPGPPRELQPMWPRRRGDRRVPRGRARARSSCARRCCGCSGSPSRRSPRRCGVAEDAGIGLDGLEITTCLRRGEIEVVTRYEPAAAGASTSASSTIVRERHADTLFSDDGSTVDEQVADAAARARPARSPRPSRAPAGCWPARLTELAGLVGLRARRARRLLQRGEGRRWRASTRR